MKKNITLKVFSFRKVLKTISSCKNASQLLTAYLMIMNYADKFDFPTILLDNYLKKCEQLYPVNE